MWVLYVPLKRFVPRCQGSKFDIIAEPCQTCREPFSSHGVDALVSQHFQRAAGVLCSKDRHVSTPRFHPHCKTSDGTWLVAAADSNGGGFAWRVSHMHCECVAIWSLRATSGGVEYGLLHQETKFYELTLDDRIDQPRWNRWNGERADWGDQRGVCRWLRCCGQ